MAMYESFRSLLFKLDAEMAHYLTIGALRSPLPMPRSTPHSALEVTVAGLKFSTPLGLAAGFDKDAKAFDRMFDLGFGAVEVGTVTPRSQPGNPSPRLFRLEEDEAVINRFGFNSEGLDAVERRLQKHRGGRGILGVNVGANKDSTDKIADYVIGVERLGRYADYLTINISSPNTPGLRDLQKAEHLSSLIEQVLRARDRVEAPPIFLKVSPDLTDLEIASISRAVLREGIDGLVVGNTTISRPDELKSSNASQEGGLSGKPLRALALAALRGFRSELGSQVPLIGVGGIASAEDAYERIRSGATLIQLYTALAYSGPSLVSRINNGLVACMQRDGFTSISEAIGADVTQPFHHVAA